VNPAPTPAPTPTAPPASTPTPLQRALAAYRQGDAEAALARSAEAVATAAPGDFGPHTVHGEVLHRTGRTTLLQSFLSAHPGFGADARGALLQARVHRRRGDADAAAKLLRGLLADAAVPVPLQRVAGFEFVEALAAQGRHDAAWDQAEATHRASTRPFDTAALVAALRQTAQAPRAELARLPRASRPAGRVAIVLGLPRSGTTLLEQMLDAHPQVQGLGELPLAGECANAIAREGGGWPVGAQRVKRATLDALQAHYLRATRGRPGVTPNTWVLDKTVFPMMQPLFVNAVLPGAKVLHLVRDARDNATSLFLNAFDASWGWTGSLEAIREVIAAERTEVPVILDKLGLDVLRLRLEDLLADPRAQMQRVLTHLGLPWHEDCLHPETNPRLVHTLSHAQVRRPLNREGIGRWRVHAARFGGEWDTLDGA
jgi:LPS sulfotransferase NodH